MHFTEQMLVLLRRACAIPGDSVPEARGTHFKRMRTMSRIQKQATKMGVQVVKGAGTAALAAAVAVEEQAGCCGLLGSQKKKLAVAAAAGQGGTEVRGAPEAATAAQAASRLVRRD